jgi:hypothetical protein
MATVNIHNFLYNKIALQRRRGPNTYTIFFWDVPAQIWRPVVRDMNPIFHHQSTSQPQAATVNITLTPWLPPHAVRGNRYQRPVLCTGKFLKATIEGQSEFIPVVTLRVPVPQSLKKREYISVDPEEPASQAVNLYTVRPAAAAPAQVAKPKPQQTPLTPIPKRIAMLIAEDACKKDESCPISMEVLTVDTMAVTTCFHVFNQDAIAGWFAQSDSKTCPVCRASCEVTQLA